MKKSSGTGAVGLARRTWKRYFFRIDTVSGNLLFFSSDEADTQQLSMLGAMPIRGARIVQTVTTSHQFQFEIHPAEKEGTVAGGEADVASEGVWHLRAADAQEEKAWISALGTWQCHRGVHNECHTWRGIPA